MSTGTTARSVGEVELKLGRVRDFLERSDLDGALFTGHNTVAWVTGGLGNIVLRSDPSFVWALVLRDRAVLITQDVEAARVTAEELPDLPGFEVVSFPWWEDGYVQAIDELCDTSRLATDGAGPGTAMPLELQQLRLALGPEEHERLAALSRDAADALERGVREARKGMTERELVGNAAARFERVGIVPVLLLAAADDRHMQFRHPTVSDRAIERDVMAVVVGVRSGLHVAATRTASLGPADPELLRRHRVACAVEARMIGATRPGATWGDAIEAGVAAYADLGFPGEWTYHFQGGAIGYGPREFGLTPAAHPSHFNDYPVLEGQAGAWNPTVQGTKSENTFLVEPSSNRVLTDSGNWPTVEVPLTAGGTETVFLPDILELTGD